MAHKVCGPPNVKELPKRIPLVLAAASQLPGTRSHEPLGVQTFLPGSTGLSLRACVLDWTPPYFPGAYLTNTTTTS